jgi:hypothetical protein
MAQTGDANKTLSMSVLLGGIPPHQPFWGFRQIRRRIIKFTQEFLKCHHIRTASHRQHIGAFGVKRD